MKEKEKTNGGERAEGDANKKRNERTEIERKPGKEDQRKPENNTKGREKKEKPGGRRYRKREPDAERDREKTGKQE
jgi:hypothetical protein